AQNSMGVGWNDARPELVGKFNEVLQREFASLGLTPTELNGVTGCCADRAIEFLNKTDCSYQYNMATTSEAEHLAEQEVCFTKVKYEEEEGRIALACFKEKLPDDWKLLRSSLVESFVKAAVDGGVDATQAKVTATCFADRAVKLANERKCPLINKQAPAAEHLFNDMTQCISAEESEKLGSECSGPSAK
ncbi:MAG TPA: hypothetical protein VLC09_19905, partial [Polyangiaceae bacterium]|nr:hypothetical protein [Polyangiaceae bacterium]